MTSPASTLAATAVRPASSSRLRVLGAIGMLCAPTFLLGGLLAPRLGIDATSGVWSGVGSLVYMTGFACSVMGLRLMRATGEGRAPSIFHGLQATLLALALAYCVLEISGVDRTSTIFRITDIAWPLSHVLMLVVFAMVMRARRVTGWRRFGPLVLGLALPSFLVLRALLGTTQPVFFSFPLLTTIGCLTNAWTVFTGTEAKVRV